MKNALCGANKLINLTEINKNHYLGQLAIEIAWKTDPAAIATVNAQSLQRLFFGATAVIVSNQSLN